MNARRVACPIRAKPDTHEFVSMPRSSTRAQRRTSRPAVAMVAASLDLFGGQSIQADALASCLRAEGWHVDMVPVNPRFPRGLRWLRRVPYLRTIANEICYLPSLVRLRKADVIHIYSASYFSFLLGPAPALLAARLLGKRAILNYHSGEAEDHLAHWGILVHPWLRLAHEIVVPSQFLREVFGSFGYAARVVANIADTSAFDFRERDVEGAAPRLLSTRNLESHYGVETLVRAFVRIQKRYPGASLVIAGDGSEAQRLQDLAEALELNNVRFRGAYRPPEAPRLYADADLFLNASAIDNQPVSVLEAFASGLPVVSTATGDIGAMLAYGDFGVIVPPKDPQAIADAVALLIEEPARRREMARQAYDSLERFCWERVREDWAAAYNGERTA
jgi:glycosyltransferase involved in cell wall biosynthesis